MSSDDQHITIEVDDRVVAAADLHLDPDAGVLHADLHLEAGHRRPGTGADLVDTVLAEADAAPGTPLQATLPAGDAESLIRLRERCDSVQTRPAGATVIAEGSLPRD